MSKIQIKRIKPSGVEVIRDNRKLIVKGTAVTLPLDDKEVHTFFAASNKFISTVNQIPSHTSEFRETMIMSNKQFDGPFVKYVKKDVYEKYIKKGNFQLGTIQYYQKVENPKIRDEYEGFSNLLIPVNQYNLCYTTFSGFEYLIFCGTLTSNSVAHKDQFGEVQITIPNINSFANAIQKSIGAKSYVIGRVSYDNLKLFKANSIMADNLDIDNLFTHELLDYVDKFTLAPSLFVKPEAFNHEQEVRIVFEMNKVQKGPKIINNLGLKSFMDVRYL